MNITKLRKKEANELKNRLRIAFPKAKGFLEGCDEVAVVCEGSTKLLVIGSTPAFVVSKGSYIPTLALIKLRVKDLVPRVVVDEGAVKHLMNGADVMIPGITEYEEFNVDDLVSVWEPRKESPIVVGRALVPSGQLREQKKGKAIKNLHYVGDEIWNLCIKVYREFKV